MMYSWMCVFNDVFVIDSEHAVRRMGKIWISFKAVDQLVFSHVTKARSINVQPGSQILHLSLPLTLHAGVEPLKYLNPKP
jgi:hypothetical protein